MEYIDLGLPSKTIWAKENEPGFFTHPEAMANFGNNLPTEENFKELNSHCKYVWDDERKGVIFTGPNGNSIFLPAAGHIENNILNSENKTGNYWTYDQMHQYQMMTRFKIRHYSHGFTSIETASAHETRKFTIRLCKKA